MFSSPHSSANNANSKFTELQDNLENGWQRVTHDVPPINPKFTDTPGLNFETNLWEPEVFFKQLFDHQMFTIKAEETNNYAHQQIRRFMGGRDQIQMIEHYSHKRHARLGTWRDVNISTEMYISQQKQIPRHLVESSCCRHN